MSKMYRDSQTENLLRLIRNNGPQSITSQTLKKCSDTLVDQGLAKFESGKLYEFD